MSTIPIRDIPGNQVAPSGNELILIDNGIEMQKASINDAVTPKATEIADEKVATISPRVLPAGGTTGQVPAKASDSDYDVQWVNAGAGDLLSANNLSDVASAKLANAHLGQFDATSDAAAAHIPPVLEFIRTSGYSAPGDGGGALYKRVETEPSHAGKIQSADGAWWELAADQRFSVEMFGGSFTDLETFVSGSLIDLNGKTYLVEAIPTGNTYVNGFWTIDVDLNADESPSIIASVDDSGGREPAFTGGVENTPTTEGATTRNLVGVMWSQNCRSEFVRAGNISSIYSWAYGNVSLNGAARQSIAGAPQAVNLGTEECEVYGFRGANISSHYSETTGGSGGNYSSRYSSVSAQRQGANLASVFCQAGRGKKCRLTPIIVGGEVDSITIDEIGEGYFVGQKVTVYDRSGPGSGADYEVATIDGNGGVTALTKNSAGSGYSGRVDAVVQDIGVEWTANVASGSCVTAASQSVNVASRQSTTSAAFSGNFASDASVASGLGSANVASLNGTASGQNSAILASAGGLASGNVAAVVGAIQCQATGIASTIHGRRTINAIDYSLALGNSAAGSPSTANRRHHLLPSGDYQLSGTVAGSTIFTDYAEYFENADLGTIDLGTLVALEGRKVRPARLGDEILGAVSATALVVAGDSPFTWQGRFLTGEFGEVLYGDVWDEDQQAFVRGPLESPDFDPSQTNIPRSKRPDEWTCVGLLGQVHVRVDQTVIAGAYVAAGDGGVGTAAEGKTNLRCMEIRRPFDPEKGYAVAFCLIR